MSFIAKAAAFVSVVSMAVACGGSAADEEPVASGDQAATATTTASTATKDGTYHASCSNKFAAIELDLVVAEGKAKSLGGKISGRNGKLRIGNTVVSWSSELSGGVKKVEHAPARPHHYVLEAAGELAFRADELKLHDESGDQVDTVGTCSTTASVNTLEIQAKSDEGTRSFRSVKLLNVGVANERCLLPDSPLDEDASWEFFCDEEDGAADATGLEALGTALAGLK